MMIINEIIDKSKNILSFEMRHNLQLFFAGHPYMKPNFIIHKENPAHYIKFFYNMIDKLDIDSFENKTLLEVGAGQYLLNAFLEYQMGSEKVFLIDIDDLAHSNRLAKDYVSPYIDLMDEKRKKRNLPVINTNETIISQLKKINAEYMTEGSDSYKKIEDKSIDIIYSNTVLQHIRRNIFDYTISEMARVLKPGGIMYHSVDLKDMLGGKKRHLEVSTEVWENDNHYAMACYTNRLQCNEMCNIFEKNGFIIRELERDFFHHKPVEKLLCDQYKYIEDEELYTERFRIIIEKK